MKREVIVLLPREPREVVHDHEVDLALLCSAVLQQVLQFRAVGGKAPFRYGVIDGSGTVSALGWFKAPLEAQNVTVEVVDAVGRSATAAILVKAIPKADKLIRLKNLEFDFDKDTLSKKSRPEMEKIIATLFDLNVRSLIIEGHTDSMGSDDYNQALSERRAKAIKNILKRCTVTLMRLQHARAQHRR